MRMEAILNKVRHDCETYWVGGNGSVDTVADHQFDPHAELDRNVVLLRQRRHEFRVVRFVGREPYSSAPRPG